jgi:hypothetical protein
MRYSQTREYQQGYYQANIEHIRERARLTRLRYKVEGLCPICRCPKGNSRIESKCDTCSAISQKGKGMTKEQRLARKLAVFERYGGCKCVCCGEIHPLLLCMDHINNDGAEHRQTMWKRPPATKGGGNLYGWLVARKYPSGFQVMCHSCNIGKFLNGGTCPHVASNAKA